MLVLLRLLAFLALGYVALCVVLYLAQRKLVYLPGPPPSATPADQGLDYRELMLETADHVRIHAWFLPAREARGAVLVCHGNAGNIQGRIETARAFLEQGWSVLLFDYRGYGKSEGTPDEEGTYLDAEAAHDYLVKVVGIPSERIVPYGESLGVGVALELARRRSVPALVAEAGFTSLADVGAHAYPLFPVRLLARYRYDNLSKIAELRCPLLLIHSPEDEIVPIEHAQRLLAAAHEPKRLLLTEADHNGDGFLRHAKWRREVGEFLNGVVPAAAGR